MVFGWLRGKGNKDGKSAKRKELEARHPFDRAATEINDALAELKLTTEEIEDRETRRETMELLKRLQS